MLYFNPDKHPRNARYCVPDPLDWSRLTVSDTLSIDWMGGFWNWSYCFGSSRL